MNLSPLTLFILSFFVGGLGGLWSVVSSDESAGLKEYASGILGGSLTGTAIALLMYEKFGTTEFGQCTILGLSLTLSMAGRAGFDRILEAARLLLGQSSSNTGNNRDYRDYSQPKPYRNDPPKTNYEPKKIEQKDQNPPQEPGNQNVSWP